MLSTTALPMRSAAAAFRHSTAARLLPCLSTTASYSTTAATRPARPSQLLHHHLHAPKRACTPQTTPRGAIAIRRHASTSPTASPGTRTAASNTTTASTNAPSTTTTTPPQHDTLTWNRFLALRKTRRRLSLAWSIVSAMATTAVGLNVVLGYDIDALGAQTFGLDPIVVMGMATIGCGCVGWLIGPTIGDAVFKLWYRRIGSEIAQKERLFFQRIKKYRVDPTQSSLNNPVPDFYGEKIGSVVDYRRWLKDQRAFNLKTSGRPGKRRAFSSSFGKH